MRPKNSLEKIRRTIDDHQMISPGDHVILGLSGGPDSLCLFDALCRLAGSRDTKSGNANGLSDDRNDRPDNGDTWADNGDDRSDNGDKKPGGSDKKPEPWFTLEAVHVNHGIRGKEADADAEFVKSICDERGIRCTIVEADCTAIASEMGMSVEEAGRMVRYEAFDQACRAAIERSRSSEEGRTAEGKSGNAVGGISISDDKNRPEIKGISISGDKNKPALETGRILSRDRVHIAVAQNADDQVETMLFRLIRGTGPDGLSAIQYKRKNENGFDIIRPILDLKRAEIESYCRERGLHPVMDRTNAETDYSRNKIRLQLIPQLEKDHNPGVKAALLRLQRFLDEDRDFFQKQIDSVLITLDVDGEPPSFVRRVDAAGLAALHPSIKSRVLIHIFNKLGLESDLSMKHIDAVLSLAERGLNTDPIDLPGGFRARMSYGVLELITPEADGALRTSGAGSRLIMPDANGKQITQGTNSNHFMAGADGAPKTSGAASAFRTSGADGAFRTSGADGALKTSGPDDSSVQEEGKNDRGACAGHDGNFETGSTGLTGEKAGLAFCIRTADNSEAAEIRKRPRDTFAIFDKAKLESVYGPDAEGMITIRTRQPGDFISLRKGKRHTAENDQSSSDRGHAASASDRGRGASSSDRSNAATAADRGHAASASDRGCGASASVRSRGANTSDRGHAASAAGSSASFGRKKIQDLMVDMKIPKEKRDSIPLCAIGSEVLWVMTNIDPEAFAEADPDAGRPAGKDFGCTANEFRKVGETGSALKRSRHRYSQKYQPDDDTVEFLIVELSDKFIS